MREYTPENITDAVLEQMSTTPDPRMKEIMESAVRHLHAFARDVNLTPGGMDQGHRVHDQGRPDVHAGATGIHPVVGHDGPVRAGQHHARQDQDGGGDRRQPARAVLPREHPASSSAARRSPRAAKAVRPRWSCTAASPMPRARRIPNAQVTVWQTAADGRYDIQNSIEEIDCRGIFSTDDKGNYLIRTVRPLGYYIPLDGPVGQMVMAQKRHGMRPAHIHFLISAPGYRELVTALYLAGDEHLEDDVVFGASGDLVAELKAGRSGLARAGAAEHPLRLHPFARDRGRPARRPGRRRSRLPRRRATARQPDPTAHRRRRCWPPSSRRSPASSAACFAGSEASPPVIPEPRHCVEAVRKDNHRRRMITGCFRMRAALGMTGAVGSQLLLGAERPID